jgi:splicing factor 3B subunit 5
MGEDGRALPLPGTFCSFPPTPNADVPPLTSFSPPLHQQAKHVGTGHADTTRFEWAVNMHRDTAASLVGHHYLTAYLAVAENEAPARVAFELKQRMLLPCGLPPPSAAGED